MRRLLFSRRWLVRHALMLLVVAVFLGLGWWQWQRGLAGNARSIAYAFEWPVFAGFVVFMWWRTLRLEAKGPDAEPLKPTTPGADAALADALDRQRQAPPVAEEPDEELEAYNRYLAWLNERDRQQKHDKQQKQHQ